ncbi:voltage-dependent anion-selective channel protein 2-like [Ischnura elegans]|uniref:voltage-dependent anion-selective channel protein 2-like n=1 Tax=Ischnura elegans TaxID=197161 RepID=UPI001ED8790A|nr:voltage-dependent anion-selective channel protein 2-like [Ischnura elegans]
MAKCVIGEGFDPNVFDSIKLPKRPKPKNQLAPTYDELGGECSGVFGGGYPLGAVKLNFKTKIGDFAEVKAGGSLNNDSGDFFGNMSSSYAMKEHGLTFSESWDTSRTLGTGVSHEDNLVDGLKLGISTSFSADTGDKSCALKAQYKMENLALTMNVDGLGTDDSTVGGSSVFAYDKFMVGYQMAFSSENSELSKNNFAFGYSMGDFVLHTSVNKLKEYTGTIYRKVQPNLETGVQLAWVSDDSEATTFGIGCKYDLDENVTLRAKVDESCGVGLSLQAKIREGISFTIAALINARSINEGGHKIGMALDLEA